MAVAFAAGTSIQKGCRYRLRGRLPIPVARTATITSFADSCRNRFTNIHVAHFDLEDVTKAGFKIILKFKGLFRSTTDPFNIFGSIAKVTFKCEYSGHICYIFAQVSAKANYGQQSSFRFNTDFDTSSNAILNMDSGWQLIGSRNYSSEDSSKLLETVWCYNLTLKLINAEHPKQPIYTELYNDTHFMDFELRGEGANESVHAHRHILAASSPVFKTMLLGDWNEVKQGHVKVPGVSKDTLQHFKDYIYLKKLPETPMDCAKLLPLASYYMMPELERLCTMQIAKIFKPNDGWDWLEYFTSNIVQHKRYNLLGILFKNITSDNIEALEKHFNISTSAE